MSLTTYSLLTVLDNNSEPFSKRIKLADNAFRSSELLIPHKEVLLIKWILQNLNYNNEEEWESFNNWIISDQFKELTRNDINDDEVICIIELIKKKIVLMENIDTFFMKKVYRCFTMVMENKIFQQYFKYDIELHCQLVCCMLNKIRCPNYLDEFLKQNVFFKTIIEENFHKYFLEILFPELVQSLLKFDSTRLFQEVSRIVQKYIFHKNHKSFKLFIHQFFEEVKIEKQTVPKILFKHLLNVYKENMENAKMKYKLIMHSFCVTYEEDCELIYRFFILLIHIIGFNLKEKIICCKISKLENYDVEICLNKTQQIIFELMDIFPEINIKLDCKVKELTFTEFIRNILRQFLYFNTPADTCYKIFIKAIEIDPLVIEPIIDGIIIYTMMADNQKHKEYENLVISVFEVYAKLHRIENLVAKMVCVLNDSFNRTTIILPEIYEFRGKKDTENLIMEANTFKAENIFTKKILENFSISICNLASWQVINVFKTLLYYLDKNLKNISKIENEDFLYFTYMEILSMLISTLLSSIRVAEHTVASNVVEKSVKELEVLKNLLQQFGVALLNRQHNHILMRSFLNMAYHWAEIYYVLAYYSINNEVQLKRTLDNDVTSCNITYLHPYLNVKQWCLISERITNFGELPCKLLLKKMYIQKIKVMLLFEETVSDDMVSNVIRSITTDLDIKWKDLLSEKYVVNHLLFKMDSSSVLLIAECLLNNINDFDYIFKQLHILDSSLLVTAINYVTIIKINKLILKQKRKLNEDILFNTSVSSKICSMFTEDVLYQKEGKDILEKAKEIYHSDYNERNYEWKISEEKVNNLFKILKEFPVVYSSEVVQKMSLLYCCSLHRDLQFEFKKGNYSRLQKSCEEVIIGILQHNKFKIFDLFEVEEFCKQVVNSFTEWELVFSLITENIFKCTYSIKKYETVVNEFAKNLLSPTYMCCCIIIINTANKIKRSKMPKDEKAVAENYKTIICDKILEIVSEHKPEVNIVNGYAYALRNFLSQNDDKLSELLKYLNSYVEFAVSDMEHCETYITLFLTLLQNKSKIQLKDDFPYKIWNVYKENDIINSRFEEYAQLVLLIFGYIPNEQFDQVTTELLNTTDNLIKKKEHALLSKHLKTWESVVSCNLNPIKIKILYSVIEKILQKLMLLLLDSEYEGYMYESIFKFEKTVIQTNHLHLTLPVIDILILSTTVFMRQEDIDYKNIFNLAISLLENLLKHRKPLILDRLPPYLQQYRTILKSLCQKSKSDLNLENTSVREISDCAHLLEKLTKNLVSCQKDMGRIAMYLIADILEQYEQVTLYPNVKIHLNNCIYSLISICDQHAVMFLMRALSSASIEIFKVMYENYKKYYRFTGKI